MIFRIFHSRTFSVNVCNTKQCKHKWKKLSAFRITSNHAQYFDSYVLSLNRQVSNWRQCFSGAFRLALMVNSRGKKSVFFLFLFEANARARLKVRWSERGERKRNSLLVSQFPCEILFYHFTPHIVAELTQITLIHTKHLLQFVKKQFQRMRKKICIFGLCFGRFSRLHINFVALSEDSVLICCCWW